MIMTVNDLPYGEITFQDTYKQQSIDLEKFMYKTIRMHQVAEETRKLMSFPTAIVNMMLFPSSNF
jgi:hypothetical protein